MKGKGHTMAPAKRGSGTKIVSGGASTCSIKGSGSGASKLAKNRGRK